MFENFNTRARKVMALANEISTEFKHAYLETEHILLAILKEGNGVAIIVLQNLGINLNLLESKVKGVMGLTKPGVDTESTEYPNKKVKEVIASTFDQARGLDHNYIGTEHLLLGLIHEEKGIAHQVLTSLGLTIESIRNEIIKVLGTGAEKIDGSKERPVKCKIFQINESKDLINMSSVQIDDFLADGKKIIHTFQSSTQKVTHITIFYREK